MFHSTLTLAALRLRGHVLVSSDVDEAKAWPRIPVLRVDEAKACRRPTSRVLFMH